MGELTVFPLGPGNGDETERVASGSSRQGEQVATLVLGEETGELLVPGTNRCRTVACNKTITC
jgi:hypothetical protein